jgi:putative peptidoglycan lipid II flippase
VTSPTQRQTPRQSEQLDTRAAGIVGIAVLASRVLGVARELIFAALFGGGRVMDAFTIAFRTPNLLRDLFAEGALSTAFITVFSKTVTTDGDTAAWQLANRIATLAFLFLSGIVVIGVLIAPWLVALLAPGFDADKAALTVTLTRIMYPFILLVSLAALAMGLLNAKHVFGMPAMASSFFNVGSIVGGAVIGWWIDPAFGRNAVLGLAVGTLIGGALQLGVQLPALRRVGYAFRPDFHWRDSRVREVLLLMGPSVIAASSTQVNVLVNSIFASHLVDGAVFWLSIAFRLVQLPLGVFGVALGTVALPLLSRLIARGDLTAFRSELARGLRLAFLLTIPSTVGLMLLAEPIMSVLYQHGRFTAEQAAEAAGALRFYAIGLAGYAALKVLVNSFYALGKRRTPMYVSFAAIGVNALLGWLFVFRLGLGHRGLALATGCIATLNFLLLYLLMHRALGHLETRAFATMLLKVTVACVGLAAVCLAGRYFLLADWATMRLVPKLAALTATVAVGGATFFALALVLKVEEIAPLAAAVKRRLAARRAG